MVCPDVPEHQQARPEMLCMAYAATHSPFHWGKAEINLLMH